MKIVLEDLEKGQFMRTQVSKVNSHESEARLHSLNSMNQGKLEYTDDFIEFDSVPIVSPNGDVIINEMTFKVQRGMNTVVTGPNGCGKSSLFRVLSGLWHLAGGTLRRPHMDKLFYIPQRPYLPPGTLRDQVIYPNSKKTMEQKAITDQVAGS
jgi:ATP-binding cassette subfamily D (ALD) protein 3